MSAHHHHHHHAEPPENLSGFRYHTGATLRPLEAGEPCPLLFRDIGPQAMVWFLEGKLQRLAGPFSPIIYMRTCDYREPYTDYGRIGRLAFLQPLDLHPWHSGVETIYVAHASRMLPPDRIGFIPGDMELHDAARKFAGVQCVQEMRDVIGASLWQDMLEDHRQRLTLLNRELAESERVAEPLRRELQSGDRQAARELMQRHSLTESDLCTAWHHLPADRRGFIRETLATIGSSVGEGV